MNGDTISRQAAIKVLEERLKANGYSNTALVSELNRSIGYLMRLPSAERRGRWIENEFVAYCSECGLYAYRSNGIPWKSNYCPICGASMMDDNAIQHTKCVGNALDALDEVKE